MFDYAGYSSNGEDTSFEPGGTVAPFGNHMLRCPGARAEEKTALGLIGLDITE